MLAPLLLALTLSATPAAPVPVLGPLDAIGFDYDRAAFVGYLVLAFEVSWDGGAWGTLGIPEIAINAGPDPLAGTDTYKVIPPFTSGTHSVIFRACNLLGCGAGSVPFDFAFLSGVAAPPSNVRKIPR